MAGADEIRRWGVGHPKLVTPLPGFEGVEGGGALFFAEPIQPANVPGAAYLRCAGEQRVIVETEIAAQLAELNATLRELRDVIREKRVTPRTRRRGH